MKSIVWYDLRSYDIMRQHATSWNFIPRYVMQHHAAEYHVMLNHGMMLYARIRDGKIRKMKVKMKDNKRSSYYFRFPICLKVIGTRSWLGWEQGFSASHWPTKTAVIIPSFENSLSQFQLGYHARFQPQLDWSRWLTTIIFCRTSVENSKIISMVPCLALKILPGAKRAVVIVDPHIAQDILINRHAHVPVFCQGVINFSQNEFELVLRQCIFSRIHQILPLPFPFAFVLPLQISLFTSTWTSTTDSDSIYTAT